MQRLMTSDRGFQYVTEKEYTSHEETRLVAQSSAVGNYPDSMDKPGSSFLWIGSNHHLNREEVRELMIRLNVWLNTGQLEI